MTLYGLGSGLAVNVLFCDIHDLPFSIPSFTLQQNSDSLRVNNYLTRKHFRVTYTDNLNFFRAG